MANTLLCAQLARGLQAFIAAEFGFSLPDFPDLRSIISHSPQSLCEHLRNSLVQRSEFDSSSPHKDSNDDANAVTARATVPVEGVARSSAASKNIDARNLRSDPAALIVSPKTLSSKVVSPKWDWAFEASLDPAIARHIQQSSFFSSDIECKVQLLVSSTCPKPCQTSPSAFPLLSRYRFFGNALLTGATGFLGAHILGDLIAVMHQSLNPVHGDQATSTLAPVKVQYFRHYRSISQPKHLEECDRALPRRKQAFDAAADIQESIVLPQSNRVYCLVRLKHTQLHHSKHDLQKSALQRIQESLSRFGILDKLRTSFGIIDWHDFVVPVVGDLEKPRLGLTGALGGGAADCMLTCTWSASHQMLCGASRR